MLVFLRIVKFYPSGPTRSAEKIPCVKRHWYESQAYE